MLGIKRGSVIFGRERGIGYADPFAPAGVLAKHLDWPHERNWLRRSLRSRGAAVNTKAGTACHSLFFCFAF